MTEPRPHILEPQSLGRIGVLMGGCSSERKISLKSGRAVYAALKNLGADAVGCELDTTEKDQILKLLADKKVDVVFIALHGEFGEDGQVQEILEQAGLAYTGCGPLASRQAMNKSMTQEILVQAAVPVPDYAVIKSGDKDLVATLERLGGFPVVAKPAAEGSSIGITVVRESTQLAEALDQAFQHGPDVLLERYIDGRELTVGILAGEALPVVEIRPRANFFDFRSKYEKGQTEYLVPAPLDRDLSQELQRVGLAAFDALGCRDLARVDIMLSKENKPFVLEVNTIPGFTETSLLPMAANCRGIGFEELCWRLTVLAAQRQCL